VTKSLFFSVLSQKIFSDRIRGMKQCVFWLFLIFSTFSYAHPTSYEGGYSLMTEMHPDVQEISMIYSPKYWLGAGVVTMRAPDRFELVTSQIGWLVNRWNLSEAQGNFYLVGGLGYGNRLDENLQEGAVYRLGAQADFETRRIYTFLKYVEHRFTDDGSLLNNQLSAAVGFAPYLGEFDELNSWVIFKVVAQNEFNDFIYLPMMRFFYKNFLWEIGQDFKGNSQFNFMVRF